MINNMDWDDHAATWDDDPAVVAYADAALESLVSALSARDTGLSVTRILDFGCGTGRLTALMAEHVEHVVGYDVSAAMIERLSAKNLPNVTAVATLNGVGSGFSGVTCSSVCALVPDYLQTVQDLVWF